MRQVIVSGLPRSGTSWTARALSFDPTFSYCREPDNWQFVPGWDRQWEWLYAAGTDDPPAAWTAHMERALTGQIMNLRTMEWNLGPILPLIPDSLRYVANKRPWLFRAKPNRLIKMVRVTLAHDWIVNRFPAAELLVVTRHPAGEFASWQRLSERNDGKGWELPLEALLDDEKLMDRHLRPYEAHMRRASGFWETATAIWGAVMRVVFDQHAASNAFHIVPFEWLCEDAETRFREVYARLGLTWSKAASGFLAKSDTHLAGSTY